MISEILSDVYCSTVTLRMKLKFIFMSFSTHDSLCLKITTRVTLAISDWSMMTLYTVRCWLRLDFTTFAFVMPATNNSKFRVLASVSVHVVVDFGFVLLYSISKWTIWRIKAFQQSLKILSLEWLKFSTVSFFE